MIFCTYCGKSFTRKEHLERHIPSHTNVKPHRCTLCQLSFPRRDLLQRHHFTYHEVKEPMQPVPGGVPPVAGRTPIACINCASAKTGCDKRVPCSRCAEKNLPCEARFARRTAKAASRQASSSSVSTLSTMQHTQIDMSNGDHMVRKDSVNDGGNFRSPSAIDPQLQQGSPPKKQDYPPPGLHAITDVFIPSPNESSHAMDAFMCLNDEFLAQEVNYQDLMIWNQYPSELEMYPNSGPELHHPLEIPEFMELAETASSSEAIANGSMDTDQSMSHTRTTSVASQPEYERPLHQIEVEVSSTREAIIIAAEAAWPLARCNRAISSGACPRTAIIHLENLEQHSRQESTWKLLDHSIGPTEEGHQNGIVVVPLNPRTRDRILAITQSFLHTALETHMGGLKDSKSGSPDGTFNYLVLPPSNILEYFLRIYVQSLAPYYTLITGSILDPNEVLLNNQASTLLLLLMIASGALSLPSAEARCLAAGLTETCRISLFHIIEKDVELSADPVVLRSALLFTIIGAWSGDAWHMNIAMGQRGMYLAMVKHAGMLEPSPQLIISSNDPSSRELQWRAWQQREIKSRLVYNWVMVDQELSLFHDTAPILSITELERPVPGPESLWLAKNATEWFAAVQQTNNTAPWMTPNSACNPPLMPSLCDLFQDMLHDNMNRRHDQLSPLQLRLLLHPLQSLLCHLRQVLSCFSDFSGSHRGSRTVTKASTLLRLEEVQSLLQKWYEICAVHTKADPNCPITRANLVLYHLISLNAITSFPEIERLARKEGFDGSSREISLRYKRCIHQPEEALFHCGQVMRLISSMPTDSRPHWWSAAIYRAGLILWVESLSRMHHATQRMEKGQIFAINAVMPDHPSLVSYLWSGEGIPVLTNGDRHFKLQPDEVLSHCISLLDQGVSMRISDGFKRKLQLLSQNWSTELMQNHV